MTDLEKPLCKIALKCFKDLQRIMGDRKPGMSAKSQLEVVRNHIDLALREPALRDELYLQVLKQITENPARTSLMKGWEVMCVYSVNFPPSKELTPVFLRELCIYGAEVSREQRDRACCAPEHMDDPDVIRYRIAVMEHFVSGRIQKVSCTGPRRHLPSTEEVGAAMESPFKRQVFSVSLDEIMEFPENRDDTGLYPRVLTFLAESILLLKGTSTEGIFRVPGFIDEVRMLRMRIERGQYSIEGIHDPSTAASLLKLWLRELTEPVIQSKFYERCLMVGSDVDEAIRILDELPTHNRNVLKYLIKFLQVVGDPRYQAKTKMSVSNLAMVFAPNVLRCPSDNPLVILANSKFEQSFLKALINYLED